MLAGSTNRRGRIGFDGVTGSAMDDPSGDAIAAKVTANEEFEELPLAA